MENCILKVCLHCRAGLSGWRVGPALRDKKCRDYFFLCLHPRGRASPMGHKYIFFVKSTFLHAGQRQKVLSRPSADSFAVGRRQKKSTFFHAGEKVMISRIWMFRGGWELILPS
jgi:hypothetical protein